MKKFISMMLTLMLLMLTIVMPTLAESPNEALTGGWSSTQTSDIPQDALDALNKALEGLEGATYKPVSLLATQVVAGTNYAFLCYVTPVYPGAAGDYCVVYVYADLEGNAEILRVQDLMIADDELTDGGWSTAGNEEIVTAAQEALMKALEGLVGADYEFIEVLGYQVVAGMNYEILCRVTPVYPDAEGSYCMVGIYEDLDGTATITHVSELVYSMYAESVDQ